MDDYNIVKAIHFSNGGGVYKALGIKDKKEYILKEGRLNAGWDRNNEDAFTRINNEYITLKKLSRVKEVVNVFDIFTEWESNFLVEEYIEGVPLTDWTASNFPFIKNNNNRNDYLLKVKKIMTNMIDVISTIHNNGLAIGDLQPNNIMVDKSLNIKLIDFEASKYVKSKQKLSLGTPGFLKDNLSTVEENDWHSLINILLYIFLPIGPVHSLNSSVIPKYIRHIKKIFGQTATNFISDFIDKCNLILEKNNYEKYQICTLDGNNLINIENIEDFSKKIVKTALKNLDFNELRPLKGDIRQFEYELGRYNYLTGIYGCIYALSKFIDIPNEWDEWILKHSNFSMNRDLGFFTGKSGIGMILYELGFTQQADSIFEDILLNLDDLEKLQDISMLSGYSGIGFSLVRYYKRTKKEVYFNKSLEIADYLIKLYKDKFDINYPFEDFGKVGIMTGWAGVAYYLLELYKINKLDYLLDYAKKCINYDLSKCKYDGKDGLYVDNNGILSPYLLGGSAGLALVILKFKSIGINDFNSQLEEIIKIIKSSNFYNIGLFRGALGILYIAAQCKNSSEDINNLVDILNIYLVTDGDNIYVPGEFSYKYSEDIFSGRAGLLLVLKELLNDKKNNLFEII